MRGKVVIWVCLYTVGAIILSLPYIYYLVIHEVSSKIVSSESELVRQIILGQGGKLAVVLLLSALIGLIWSRQVGLAGLGDLEEFGAYWQRIIVYGAFIGMAVYTFGDRYFIKLAPEFYPTQLKYALFIPFYAALVEEVFARYGVMTLLMKLFRNVYLANLFAALIFAVGHVNLFRVAGVIYRLNYLTFCSLFLNVGISLFFGYVYWKKGLLTAMGIHFVANLRYILLAMLLE